MCGIAGLIHRGSTANIGHELTDMLQALKHRGPDSTGFALYSKAAKNGKGRRPAFLFERKIFKRPLPSCGSNRANCHVRCHPSAQGPPSATSRARMDRSCAAKRTASPIKHTVAVKNPRNQTRDLSPNKRAVDLIPISASSSAS